MEVKRGNVESELAFSEKSLKDFSSVLVASSGTKTFQTGWVDNNSNLTHTDFILTGKDSGGSAISNVSIYASSPFAAYLQTGYNTSTTGTYFYVAADGVDTGSFELTGLVAGEYGAGQFTNVQVIGIKPDNSTIVSSTITGSGSPGETFTFSAGQLSGFSGVKLKAFKLVFDTTSGSATKPFFEFRSFSITGALAPLPVVTDGRISISGASGTGGAYKIGDTVTATWNNTAGGDNNTGITGVTVDFSQFGGGAAVAATNSSGTWTATYTIIAGAIDNTSRNVSVTATNAGGNTTTADTTNATVDNIVPTVTDGRISISGASGTSGAYKIGDTVTATWNNTAGGDNNSDTISSVTVNFTQFGGGAAVSASNSSGTWTATYTIVAGAIDNTNRNVTVTATDNAGNTTSRSDTSNATVDNIAPSVSSITPAGGAVSSDTTVDFTVDFSESVSNVSTDDFTRVVTGSAAGTIASVSASSGDPITVTVGAISCSGTLKVNLNGASNIVDDAGNSIAAYSSGTTHTVNILTAPDAPTIGAATAGDGQVSVAFSAPGSNGGSAITGYTVTSNPGGITGGGNGFTTSPITVSGLTNGQAYTFTVTATNAIGTSTASGASGSATPKADQTITFANPGSQNFGTTPPLSGTSTSGLTVTFSSSTTGVCTVSGTTLTFVTAGSCTIDADQAGNASTNAAPTVSRTFTVNAVVPGAPTIGTATAGDTQADVAFSVPASNGGATITGYTVTSNPGGFTGTGAGSPITVTGLTNGISYTFTVTATNSAGTGAASGASNSITPASPQVITFANPGAQSFGTSPDLSAGVSSSSGLTVAFTSSTTGVCTITSPGVLTFVATGTCTINANQAGDSTYLPAPQVTRSFTVNPANQTITFANPGAQNFGGSPTLSGSSTSGLTVTFSSSTTGVCTITSGGALTFVTAGSCTIDADQAGNATTNAAMTVSRTFTVNAIVPGAPTIGTATAGDTQADVAFTVPVSNGGATITGYTVTSNPGGFTGTGGGSPITVTGLSNGVSYTFTVTATNVAGTGGASGPSNSITPASPQVITFANPGTQSFGTAPDLSILGGGASSTSGLTVAFTSSTTGVCTITSGGILAFVTAGTCTINVNQAGNSQYLPAPQVSRSFTVSPIVPDAPTIGTAVAGDTQASVAFTAPANTGGTTITGYTVTVSPPDVAPVNGASSPIVVTGLTNGQAYTFTVTADNSAGTGPASGASNSITPKATQTITFNNPGARNFGTTPTFTATSDSGLSPTFTSSTTGVCTITGLGAVTFITAGTCTINADQAGNGSYLAATQVTRSFAVNAVVPGAPIIGTATAGNAQATVTFTAPASNGGVAITGYTVIANPGGATMTGAGSPIIFTGLTNGTSYTFTVTATNSAGTGTASAASNAVIPNSAPVIGGVPALFAMQGEAYSFTPNASDADGDVLTFSISGQPGWANFDAVTGTLSGTPTEIDLGAQYTVEISVSDGVSTVSLPIFTLQVGQQVGDISVMWLHKGNVAGERIGSAIALFDLNGDNRAEVLAGAPERHVLSGGKKLKRAGGIDVLAASNGAVQQSLNTVIAKQRFGSALAVVPDQNTDGIPDLVVGKPYAGKGGEIALHSGSDGSLLRTLLVGEAQPQSSIAAMLPLCSIFPSHPLCVLLGGTEQGSRIGGVLAVADANADGSVDLIVGLPNATVNTPVKLRKAGSVVVYDGLSDIPLYARNGTQAGERFGASVAAGAQTLWVGSPNYKAQGVGVLKYAGRVQWFDLQDGTAAAQGEKVGESTKRYFGTAVASFGADINGDGQIDWAAAEHDSELLGVVKLFSKGNTQSFASLPVAGSSKKPGSIQLAGGLDINGDGVPDLVIAVPKSKEQVLVGNKTKVLVNAGRVQAVSGNQW
ncbi:MAG: fibronectin type III domain-containing protein [Cellvibrionales bacterium]|nr:fibronectin type III domain-containing protein [Cellvibrionales bacterium]